MKIDWPGERLFYYANELVPVINRVAHMQTAFLMLQQNESEVYLRQPLREVVQVLFALAIKEEQAVVTHEGDEAHRLGDYKGIPTEKQR